MAAVAPSACTTIEEVGSTGVGALTIAFLVLGVSTIVFIARAGSATGEKIERRVPGSRPTPSPAHRHLAALAPCAGHPPQKTCPDLLMLVFGCAEQPRRSFTTARSSPAVSRRWPTSPCSRGRDGPPSLGAGSSSTPAMLTGPSPPPSSSSSSVSSQGLTPRPSHRRLAPTVRTPLTPLNPRPPYFRLFSFEWSASSCRAPAHPLTIIALAASRAPAPVTKYPGLCICHSSASQWLRRRGRQKRSGGEHILDGDSHTHVAG